jgi:hypothetical protein
MPRPVCPPEENVLRAIHSAHWDESRNHKSSAIFKGKELSVSRLSVLNVSQLFAIFHEELDKSPSGEIVVAGEINIGRLQEIGRNYTPSIEITIEEHPLPKNPAHAEVVQEIKQRGLARKIIEALIIHHE